MGSMQIAGRFWRGKSRGVYVKICGCDFAGPASLFGTKRCDRYARQFMNMLLTLRILDRQGACGPITSQSLLLSAKFGIEVATRQLKQRVCRVFFSKRAENAERFFILLIVTVQVQSQIKAREV